MSNIRWSGISQLQRREYLPADREPVVSFTFDDFPRSALEVGGAVLRSYGANGTYYAAMGLMGLTRGVGEQPCAEDLKQLLVDGHELGSHTFSHLSCRSTPLKVYQADAQKGREAVVNLTDKAWPHHFCYPYGHFTRRVIRRVSTGMTTCRCTIGGINVSPLNLHLLRANNLYSDTFDSGVIEQLFRITIQRRGWLIFYTHDIRDAPSSWGCRPAQFETVVRLAARMGVRILTVSGALEAFGMGTLSNAREGKVLDGLCST